MLKPLSRAKAVMLVNEIMSQHSNPKAHSLLVEPTLKHRFTDWKDPLEMSLTPSSETIHRVRAITYLN